VINAIPEDVSGLRFDTGAQHGPVRSYHHGAWQGLVTGGAKSDTSNGTNDLIFIEHLDPAAALAAFEGIANRHPFIMGRIEEREGAPWLVPGEASGLSIKTLDLRDFPPHAREQAGREAIGALVWEAIDVHAGPLSRFYVIRIDETLSAVGFVVHHFVCDDASVAILRREFLGLYEATRDGKPPPAFPKGVAYGDYLRAITDWMSTPQGASARKAAFARLSDLPVLTFPRWEISEPEHVTFSSPSWSDLSLLARRLKTTPFTLFLSVHNLCLLDYAGDGRVATRIVTTGRDSSGLLHTVGNLADRFYVISDLHQASTFHDVFEATTRALTEARAHAFVRDEFVQYDLWEASLPRDLPALNFIGGRGSPGSARYPGLKVPQPARAVTRPRDCYYLVLRVDEDRLSAYVRFGAGRIPGLCARLGNALSAVCEMPDASIRVLRKAIDRAEQS
jgi:hypothetical protein